VVDYRYILSFLSALISYKSAGIILSGMGSDGSLGIKSIKEQRGFVLVQEPATKFDSMPLHATQAILVDIVAPVEEFRQTDCIF
jgi:chemotaxis response regulator CheB